MIARLERRLRVESSSLPNAQEWLPGSTEGTVFLVADGMGGTAAGDVASSVAIQAIADYVVNVLPWADKRKRSKPPMRNTFSKPEPTLYGIRSGLTKALVEGDAKVRSEARARGARSMGTTLTVAYIQWPHLYVAHAGDSRCYLLRRGHLRQLTTDHTLAEKLRAHSEELDIDESSPWHHVLWNALGGGDHSAIEPEVHREELEFGDKLVVCSDGLTKHVSDDAIVATLQGARRSIHACETLVELTLEDGGTDNVTVVVASCREQGATDDLFDAEDATQVRGRPYTDPLEQTMPLTPVQVPEPTTQTAPHAGANPLRNLTDWDPDMPIDSDSPTLKRGGRDPNENG